MVLVVPKKVQINVLEALTYLFSQYPSQLTGTHEDLVHWRSANTRRRSGARAPVMGSDFPRRTAARPHELQDSERGPGRSVSSGINPQECPLKGWGACRYTWPISESRPACWTQKRCHSSRSHPLWWDQWRRTADRLPTRLPRSHRWLITPQLQDGEKKSLKTFPRTCVCDNGRKGTTYQCDSWLPCCLSAGRASQWHERQYCYCQEELR